MKWKSKAHNYHIPIPAASTLSAGNLYATVDHLRRSRQLSPVTEYSPL
jgi:hypothetical protein